MSLRSLFATDKRAEIDGVWVEFEEFRIRVARAGGANEKFEAVVRKKTKPHRRAIQTDSIQPSLIVKLTREAFAEACITGWEYKGDAGQWVVGIKDEDDNGQEFVLPATAENFVATLAKYPDLYDALQRDAAGTQLYRELVNEEDAKN